MNFEPNADQQTFLAMLDQMMQSGASWALPADHARHQWSAALDATLEENGFFDAAREETLGAVAAAELVYRLARLPVLVEASASALLRAVLAPDLPRPVAVVEDDPARPVRLMPRAASVIRLGPNVAAARVGEVAPLDSAFAYPMGALAGTPEWQPLDADPEAARDLWRVGVAAEIAGALSGGLAAVLAHVRERRQFGRPLGSFQSVQHRLSAAATRIEGARWLALRAAQGLDPANPPLALGYAQEISTAVAYDLHQFMGAMGLTLEHPLHRWTYRVRLLRSTLGGASANLALAASRRWEAA